MTANEFDHRAEVVIGFIESRGLGDTPAGQQIIPIMREIQRRVKDGLMGVEEGERLMSQALPIVLPQTVIEQLDHEVYA